MDGFHELAGQSGAPKPKQWHNIFEIEIEVATFAICVATRRGLDVRNERLQFGGVVSRGSGMKLEGASSYLINDDLEELTMRGLFPWWIGHWNSLGDVVGELWY